MEEFDYIVAGAGSAGCVLANRLSADPKNRVLLLEGGGKDNWIWFHIPVGYLFAIGNPRADWMFKTTSQAGLNGRALNYPRGKTLGGSSAINAMIYMRGQAADYDHWRQLGLAGWGWDDVLEAFKAVEDHVDGPDDFHGTGGEWRVEHPRIRWDVLDRVRDAAEAAGVAKIDDFNTGDNEGSAYFQVNQKGGRRWSAARGFLKPALGRPNLKVVTGVMVDRVRFREGRAVSIDYRKDGKGFEALAAREIVLSAGAVGSPAILERSGVGDADRLKDHGIAPVHHLPGVGENLQDHLQIRPIYKVDGIKTLNSEYKNLFRRAMMGVDYALRRRGPLTMAPSQVGAFVKSSPDQATANLEFHFQPLSLDDWGAGLHSFSAFTASVCNLRPTSRGSIHLTGARPEDAPDIAPNYLSTDEDRQVAVDSLKWARRIVEQSPLAPYRPEEYKPGAHVTSDADMLVAAGDLGTTIFHPVGTAKMGIESDPMAVLDERLRVRGIRGLRVADASVMPSITSGNTNSPTIMIAEKAARMMLDDARADTNLR
ncbi:GMC family oxidoreductase N-terminal domain-containing protein [Aurantimonas sp. C2-6-R+9]|uniref:GMC family oxidoreductase n=1 Tax=unclassified Aurantimonas TaxID=2638230 RepID=UPI002E1767CC|nr:MULTISPECIES: GMC family oxidoreductase N-terminal domain-containing protein [unclassified Aurantimonas]MEC5292001.1 GMC family oxidoreductase N-terminal domain-containing protein [Aurantimonas sp. C2-3-R2]MEC5382153.1 GMC family oxidoreductase N-terminal domain-containing protein [Aurantimonas sp. C2-6-R+9]MEC5413087.1 GMC family oxidoreductase N-terminal domain-containing protein [Aurantimonas sp. C2-4-R8]